MPFALIDARRIDTSGLGGGADFLYTSRSLAAAAEPVGDMIVILHGGHSLTYIKDNALTYPALTTADGAKWKPSGLITPLHFGAVGDGVTDDYLALQTMMNFLVGSTSSTGAAYESNGYQTVAGYGHKYATSKPIIAGNIGSSLGVPTGYFSHLIWIGVSLKAIQGTFDWSTTFGGTENIPAAVLMFAWQLNADATEGMSGMLDCVFEKLHVDCSSIANGIYLQNTMRVEFYSPAIEWMKKNGKGICTSVGNASANPRGYKTINGALVIGNPNCKGYVEESIRFPSNPNGNWPGTDTQDSMGVRALEIQTNDARIYGLNVSRCRYALWMDNCGANMIYDSHPWSQEIYVGGGAQRIWFDNVYFDFTRCTVVITNNSKIVGFNNCRFTLGTSDRGPHLVTSLASTTGGGISFDGCEFTGTSGDITIYCKTDGTPGAFWVGIRDREYKLTNPKFGASSAIEAFFKAGKHFTIDGSDGYSYFRRTADGFGRTQVGGNLITLGLDRSVAGVAGLYFQHAAGSSPLGSAVYVTAGGNLVIESSVTTGEVVFGVNGFWGGTRVKPDSDMQIFGTSGVSTASTALKVGKNGTRSISTSGTIGSSGADYAEYHTVIPSLYGVVQKGDVLGFNADGLLTDRFDDVRGRFLIKSTEPNLVGNDVWGSEEYLCKRYDVEPVGETPEMRSAEPSVAEIAAHAEEMAAWTARRDAMQAAYEAERPKWDRLAKSGIVPVNGVPNPFHVGEYLVPMRADGGGITVFLVPMEDLTFAQYVRSIGCIIGFHDDGRPLVEVKVT